MGTIPLGGNSAYVYLWEQSNDSINWLSAAGINNLKDYSPPVLSAVTYYRRNVSSAMCEADTSSLITIDVLPPISNNIISSSQTICAGQTTDTLSGSVPLGGNSIYTYLWEESPDNINWIAATGTNTGSQYIPSLITNTTYYRRASFSSTCSNLSNSVVITLLPDISNNMISTTQIICEGQTPATINGTIPNGGDNSYTYSWEESADSINWTFAGGINNQQAYDPPALSYSMFYRRYVGSSACFTDTSNTIKITVIPSVSNNMITGSQVICSGQMPSVLTGSVPAGGTGTFVYYWEQSTDSISWSAASGINNLPDYSPFVLVSSFYYRRTVISSSCSIVSTPLKVTVLPPVSDNLISSDQTICAGSTPGGFTGSIPVGGDGMYNYFWEESNDNIAWTSASSVNNLQDYNSGPLSSTFYFRRIVSSNVCNDTSEALSVSVNPLPTVSISGSDSICEGDDLYISCNLTGSSPWTLICSDGINNITFNNIGSSVYTAIFQPTQSGNYTPVAIIDYNGCSGTVLNGSASVLVNVRPAVNAGADDSVCGLTINLNAIPSMGNGSWSSASSAVFDSAISASTSVTVQQGGEYTFTWTENNNGCQAQDDVKVNFYEPVNANAGEDMNIYFTHSGRMNATALEAGVGTWSLLSGSGTIQDLHQNNTVINDLAEGENVFKWTVVNGVCPVSEDEVTVIMHELYVPNGFSPNGDNVNDLYVIKNIEHSESSSLKIFNKWGMEVFEAENYANDWNGKGKTGLDLVEDTYYYTLRINDENYSGYIVLKRR
jgi:gliding motility-associated-like protein